MSGSVSIASQTEQTAHSHQTRGAWGLRKRLKVHLHSNNYYVQCSVLHTYIICLYIICLATFIAESILDLGTLLPLNMYYIVRIFGKGFDWQSGKFGI